MPKKTLAFVLFAALSVTAFAAQAKTVTIEGTDSLQFSVEKITATAGEKITIKLVNNSSMPAAAMSHNWVLLKQSADVQAFARAAMTAKANGYIPKKMEDQVIAQTQMIAGGETDTITFTVPSEPGKYVYICSFPGHFAAGMKGVLIVKP